ncbi:MAG: ATP synthase F1 subunit gamma [Bacteroidales bacterium]|nr:ATP synthase F1 subunit gamma [Bacteroidales bacterium]
MASLREIKDRIGSVRSTLKITSAMKLVASAKLRKAQKAIEALRPYERTLADILAAVGSGMESSAAESCRRAGSPNRQAVTAIVAIASNSSLCGGFNANVARKALETIRACEGEVEVYPLGRKMAEALRRAGYVAGADYNDLVAHPAYEKSSALARSLSGRFRAGELSRVVLVYTRFVSASSQVPVAEVWLGTEVPGQARDDYDAARPESFRQKPESPSGNDEYLLEPDAEQLVATLLPQVLMLKFYAAILDSLAAEHAARTLAMQTASDNAEDLLGELTLEYNKGRQQKITAEILDLLGGAAE